MLSQVIGPVDILDNFYEYQLYCKSLNASIQQFQKNLSFRHIYKGLLKDVQSDPSVQGIRFVCSGRFGGVEMARVESRKYGQTSLHVFSSHIDYAHGHAMTSSGLLGVKIWISYRPMAPNTSSWMNQWSQPHESSQKPQK
jgi:ribosomal protein S3